MKYKVWFWICLIISILSVLITFLIIRTQKEKERDYKEKLAQYEMKINSLNNSQLDTSIPVAYYDSIRIQFNGILNERIRQTSYYSYKPDTILMRREYEKLIYQFAEVYYTSPEMIRAIVENKPIVRNGSSFQGVPRDKYPDPRERGYIEPPTEPQNSGFDKISGTASILSFFLSFIFRFLDKRGKRKEEEERREKEEAEKKNKGIKLSDINFTIPEKTPANQKGNLIIITTIEHFDNQTVVVNLEYKGSSLTAKNIHVRISEYDICRIQNADSFPIEQVGKDKTFVVRLERRCYNAERNTRFSIDWEDDDGQHTEVKAIDFEKGIEVKE